MIAKRLFATFGLFVIALLIISQGTFLRAAPLAQNATPTPQAEEEPMVADATAEPVEEKAEESMDTTEPTVAELAKQVAALQAQVAEVQATAQRNQVNMAIYLLDQVGLHALDVQLNEDGELDASTGGRVGQVARILSTVDWPMDLAADAEHLTSVLTDLAAALESEDLESSASLATQAHEEQHALSHAATAWLSGSHGDHGNAQPSHDHGDAMASAVTDVDGLLIENVLANLALPSPTGSVWLKITNNTGEDEALTGADVPGCGVIELHDMKMENDVMTMFQVEGGEIPLPAGETVTLQRGGLHIMCINKEAPVEVGTEVEITLHFANAGDVVVTAPVVDPGAPMEMEHAHGEDSDGDTDSND
ncbi:MAG: copper chaperone PCu(A)C [Caldilineaceae bacterium]|nr:copper chaperone PCu(A)C [Caldilineaceae bacterium]